jgi:hypothetical protein
MGRRMLTREEIEARKEHLRNHPEVRRLVEILGVTVERFLEDIEEQWASCVLHDTTADEDRAKSEADVVQAAAEAFREARDEADERSLRKDGFMGGGQWSREQRSFALVGRDDN